jgi:hypothetical protein
MMSRRTIARLGAGVVLLLAAGCESSGGPPAADILAGFEPGASRADVMAALPPGGLTPTSDITEAQLDHGYLVDQYLVSGESVEVVWVHDPDAGLPTEDFREHLTPLVFRNGVLDGVGWDHLDARLAEWGLPNRWTAGPPPSSNASEVRSF